MANKFFLRTSKSKGSAKLYLRINRPSLGIVWKINSGIEVDIESWTKAEKSARNMTAYFSTEAGEKVQSDMKKIEGMIDELFEDKTLSNNDDKPILERAIKDIANADAIEAMKEQKRLERDLRINETIVADLRKQLESARIDVEREIEVIEVFQAPDLPMWPVRPKKKLIALLGVAGGACLGMLASFLLCWWREHGAEFRARLKED